MSERAGSTARTSTREDALTSMFVQLVDSLVRDYDVIDVLDHLVNTCVSILDVAAAGMLLDDLSDGLAVAAASREDVRTLEVFQSQAQEGPCWDCARAGERVHVDDLRTEPRWPSFTPLALKAGYVSVTAVPLRLRDEKLGVLGLFGESVAAIRPADERLAQAFADVATIGLLHQRSEQRSSAMAGHLRTALDSRVVIEQAKGVLAEREHLSMEEAFQRLRGHARNHNLKLTQVALDLVEGRSDLPR